ncbi:MAG TPA: HEAT repeat domain-containing protein, partial [Terriglobales bacterium]|nr:HEAT repeat domain-containing protein [Terriglobales bacterium]
MDWHVFGAWAKVKRNKKMLFQFRVNTDYALPTKIFRTATYATLLVIVASGGAIFGETLEQQARDTLRGGLNQRSTAKRTQAVRVLGLLPCDSEAAEMAQTALRDHQPQVRAAAAVALEQMACKEAIPELKKALLDRRLAVVVAAAHALWVLNDPTGYEVYYELLTGERESAEHFVNTVKDRKKMAELGFEEGLGVVPFADLGLGAVKTMHKDDGSPVRASAASALVNDKDPRVSQALVRAISHKSWV